MFPGFHRLVISLLITIVQCFCLNKYLILLTFISERLLKGEKGNQGPEGVKGEEGAAGPRGLKGRRD